MPRCSKQVVEQAGRRAAKCQGQLGWQGLRHGIWQQSHRVIHILCKRRGSWGARTRQQHRGAQRDAERGDASAGLPWEKGGDATPDTRSCASAPHQLEPQGCAPCARVGRQCVVYSRNGKRARARSGRSQSLRDKPPACRKTTRLPPLIPRRACLCVTSHARAYHAVFLSHHGRVSTSWGKCAAAQAHPARFGRPILKCVTLCAGTRAPARGPRTAHTHLFVQDVCMPSGCRAPTGSKQQRGAVRCT